MLHEFVAVDDDGFVKMLMWLLGSYHPTGPYTALFANGVKGSGKSTIGFVLRSLIDPNSCMLRGGGENEEKIVLQAHNGRVVMLDNLSSLNPHVSDTLCRVLSGSGFSTRRFHTNEEEVLFTETSPVLITSISQLITQTDLLDRTLMVDTYRLSEYNTEMSFKNAFQEAQPFILGALFNAVSTALANMGNVGTTSQYRMADFFLWAIAGEEALGLECGTIEDVYARSVKDVHELALESSSIAAAIIGYLRNQPKVFAKHAPKASSELEGTAAELCKKLGEEMDTQTPNVLSKRSSTYSFFADRRDWPTNPTQFGNRLRAIVPALKAIGIEVETRRGHGGVRLIKIIDTVPREARKEAA